MHGTSHASTPSLVMSYRVPPTPKNSAKTQILEQIHHLRDETATAHGK